MKRYMTILLAALLAAGCQWTEIFPPVDKPSIEKEEEGPEGDEPNKEDETMLRQPSDMKVCNMYGTKM